MKYSDDVKRLGSALDAVARKCWRGFPALLGQAAPPSAAQIADALNVAGVEYDAAFVRAEWGVIVAAVQAFKTECADDWNLYREYVVLKETHRAVWGGVGVIDRLAEKRSMSPYQVRELVRSVPRRIAARMSIDLS